LTTSTGVKAPGASKEKKRVGFSKRDLKGKKKENGSDA
jgi:hypothetical protein